MTAEAHGAWTGAGVLVADVPAANRLHNRTGAGTPQPGNALLLHPVEAAWLLAGGRITVDGVTDLADLLGRRPRLEVDSLCYGDLRERGLLARPAGDAEGANGEGSRFAVWPRGGNASQPPAYVVRAVADWEPVVPAALGGQPGEVVGLVDEDGAVTHYLLDALDLEGECPPGPLPAASGRLLDDRVLVEDAGAAAAWHEREHVGHLDGGRLWLAFTEAAALVRRGVLSLPGDVEARASGRQPHFPLTLPVYLELRRRGLVPRSGLKFGTHLRAYRGDPGTGHAEWLVHCLGEGGRPHWSELARGVRLAHAVRKRFVLAVVGGGGVRFAALDWFRP